MQIQAFCVPVCLILAHLSCPSLSEPPTGHLKPLGYNRPPEGTVDVLDHFPSPQQFHSEYVIKSKPLLMKNALTTYQQDAAFYTLWTDEYLIDQYGFQDVEVEYGKKEDRSLPLSHMSLSDFIQRYKHRDVYMVHNVPEAMEVEVAVPTCLHCGGLDAMLQEAVIWFSSGGTKSVLHVDTVDNINCLLDGTKDFILVEKKYSSLIEETDYVTKQGYSKVDVDSVDMYKFPNLQDLPWYIATMEKGDCFYLPLGWHHQVTTHDSRSLAVNFWFAHLHWFDVEDCEAAAKDWPPNALLPLSEFTMASPNEQFRSDLLTPFSGMKVVEKSRFYAVLLLVLKENNVDDIFHMIDKNNDDVLTWEELYDFNIDEVVKRYPEITGFAPRNIAHEEL